MKRVICENAEGRRMTFSHALPFWLASIEGVRDIRHTVSSSKAAGQDGTTITEVRRMNGTLLLLFKSKGTLRKIEIHCLSFSNRTKSARCTTTKIQLQEKLNMS